jgi:hypothetical protein
MPSAPAIIVDRALANFDLNIEPSQAMTPWWRGHSLGEEAGKSCGQLDLTTVRK